MDFFILTALAVVLVFWVRAIWRYSLFEMKAAYPVRFKSPDLILLLFLASTLTLFGISISSLCAKFFPEEEKLSVFLPTVLFQTAAIGAAFVFSRLDTKPFMLFGKLKMRYIFSASKFFIRCTPFVLLLGVVIASFWMTITGEYPERQEVIDIIDGFEGWRFAVSLISIIVLAPVSEELIFRKIFYGICKYLMFSPKHKGRSVILFPCVITSVVFALIHVNAFAFLPLFFMGLFLSLSYEKSGSIWTPIFFHAMFNGANIAILLMANEIV